MKRSLSFTTPKNKDKDKSSIDVSFVEVEEAVKNMPTGITDEILKAEIVIGETSELASTYAMAYN